MCKLRYFKTLLPFYSLSYDIIFVIYIPTNKKNICIVSKIETNFLFANFDFIRIKYREFFTKRLFGVTFLHVRL